MNLGLVVTVQPERILQVDILEKGFFVFNLELPY